MVSHFYRTAHEIWACFWPGFFYIDFEPNLEMAIDVEANRNDQEIEKNDKDEKNLKNPNSCLKTLADMAGDAKNIGEVVGKNSLKLADAVLPY